jgi:hypothetical protein
MLLDFLAKSGSEMGTFKYIQTKDIMEYLINNTISDPELNKNLKDAFDECLKMAINELQNTENFTITS